MPDATPEPSADPLDLTAHGVPRRDERLVVKLSTAEKRRLADEARAERVTLSVLIRRRLGMAA